MSGFDYRKEEWTRRKSYLLRSLFEDDPMLSTISEEDESGVQYSPKTPSGHHRARHYETRHRSPSPLPDLVVEVVPRRPKIYNDEPEEYYKRLERQMRKLYRRDFLNLPSISSDSTEPQSENESHTFEDDHCVQDDSIDQEKSIEDDQNMNLITEDEVLYIAEPHGLSPITEESTIEKSTSSISIENRTNQIETTAIIEREMEESDENNNESIHTSKASTIQSSAEAEESSKKEESVDEGDEEPTELTENNGASSNNGSVSLILEPDAMRRQEARSSLFSIGHDLEKSAEQLVTYHSKQLEFMEESLENRVTNITPRITDITGKATSTTKYSSHTSCTSRLSKRTSFGDRFEPYLSSSSSKSFVSKYDQALQTSFSEEETSNQEFWRNFIVGTPLIYMFQ